MERMKRGNALLAALGLVALLAGLVVGTPTAFAATPTSPSVPTSLTASPGDTTVVLAWTAPKTNGGSAIKGYNVYEGTSSGGENYSSPVNGGTLITTTITTVTGLTNATAYYFTVKATNSVGSSGASNEAWAIPAATVPGAPTHVVATGGDASAIVTWNAPSDLGGSNISSYTVTAVDVTFAARGGQSCTWTTGLLTCNLTGLTNGDSYTFTATATNSLGTGPASVVSNTVVPAVTVPAAPTGLTATPGNTTVALSWSAPSDGGSTIKGYNLYEGTSSGGENYSAPVNGSTLLTATTTVTGLTNGTEYYFTLKAVNAIGSSPASSEVWAIPSGTAPGAPTGLSATAGYVSATVTWTTPSDLGGSAITRYTVTAADSTVPARGGQTCTWTTGPLTCTVTGLTNGDSYTFTATATNTVGTGVLSSASSAVVPAISVPSAPTGLTATPSNHAVALSWTAPAANGGAGILGYNIFEGVTAGGENYGAPANGGVLVTGTTATLSNLTNGDTYYFTVEAVNAVGSSVASNEGWAIPAATVAGPPQDVSATVGSNGSAVVSWTGPVHTGGSSVSGYVVTPYIGATAQAAQVFDNNTATTETISSLTPGTAYSFTVAAINASGNGAQSAASNLVTVPPANTTITLSLSSSKVTYGSEQAEHFSVIVSPAYSGPVPNGTVVIKMSTTTLCTITLSAAKGSCSLTSEELPAGSFSVYANYAGNGSFVLSTSSKTKTTLIVAKASTKTTLKLSAAKVTYGNERAEHFSVIVSSVYSGPVPNGTVTIKKSTTTLCTITLSAGKGSCSLSAEELPARNFSVYANYAGNTSFVLSTSWRTKTVLSVTKASTKTTLKLSAAKVTFGHEQGEHLSVSVAPQFKGSMPTGTVTISGTSCLIKLSGGKGTCTAKAGTFHVGNHSLVAHYWGDGNFYGSLSSKSALTAVK